MQKSISIQKKTDEIEVSAPAEVSPSICSSCDNSPSCVYLKADSGVITYCEEYLDLSAIPKRPNGKTVPEKPAEPIVAKGLCINCEKNKTCGYTRPVEGIWHCEEYE